MSFLSIFWSDGKMFKSYSLFPSFVPSLLEINKIFRKKENNERIKEETKERRDGSHENLIIIIIHVLF